MLFRRIILSSFCVGLAAGLLLTILQQWQLAPIIHAAEQYEVGASPASGHGATHNHDDDRHTGGPGDGIGRMVYSLVANFLAAIGFAAILMALMCQLELRGVTRLNLSKGVCWGIAGYGVFFVSPAIGLTPEIPGLHAASLEQRQLWWVFAVVSAGIGCGLVAFAPVVPKIFGVALIALPHLAGAPETGGPGLTHANPDAARILDALQHDFVVASALVNMIFWIVLGALCALALGRWCQGPARPA